MLFRSGWSVPVSITPVSVTLLDEERAKSPESKYLLSFHLSVEFVGSWIKYYVT